MKKLVFFLLSIIIILLLWTSQGHPYAKKTHKAINENIADRTINGFSLNKYLISNLGFKAGAKEPLYGYSGIYKSNVNQRVIEWLGEGGVLEDEPEQIWRLVLNMARNNNHFHNPLKTWERAGLDDYIVIPSIPPLPPLILHYTGQSLLLWGQNPNQDPGGKWAWQDARKNFYIALTGRDFDGNVKASTKKEREKYFADTFRAVGQQMHLVQDVTVASHARNDIHALFAYEGWTEALRTDTSGGGAAKFSQMLSNPVTFDHSILNLPSNALAPIPVAKIIDTDKYSGTNPDITASRTIGIAEYTNANFLSEDTAFTRFSYPNWDSVQQTEYTIRDPRDSSKMVSRQYYKKVRHGELGPDKNGDGIPDGYRLATVGALKDYVLTYFPLSAKILRAFERPALDANVYEDYASLLIPRAVGYSAGLLNYFFRGTIEISPPDEYVYSITDGSETPYTDIYGHFHQQFTIIKAKIRNTTPDEEMKAGTVHAVAKYKIRTKYEPDLSKDPPMPKTIEDDFSYSVSKTIAIDSLSSSEPTEFTFDFKDDPIPAGITDLYLFVVFKGTLGNEKDIAIAVGMKDLTEPAHHVFWNFTDMFSLYHKVTDQYGNIKYGYHLHTSEEIKRDDRYDDLGSLVDFDGDRVFNEIKNKPPEPYIDPYSVTFEIGYMSSSPPEDPVYKAARVVDLPAGKYIRLIILQDREQFNYLRMAYSDDIEQGAVDTADFEFQEVMNQEEPNGTFYYTPVEKFRKGIKDGHDEPIRHHFFTGILRCFPLAYDYYGNPYCPYNESESIDAVYDPYPADILFK
jgi:hypothetical protein